MSQIDIPLSVRGGFKTLGAAKAHREIVAKATDLRSQAEETAQDLMGQDVAEIGSTGSDAWTDLAAGKGHVIMVGDNDDGTARGVELNYNPENGQVRNFTADTPEGKLFQGPSSPGSDLSSTFKWEEGEGSEASTTYFKFDDKRGVLSILDMDNDVPAFMGDIKPKTVKELIGTTFQGQVPIIVM